MQIFPTFLLTNDDGIEAAGIRVMSKILSGLGRVIVVAPDRERSAVSHGLTINEPLRLKEWSDDVYSLTGTPADCVLFAMNEIVTEKPDLVVSGINAGCNLGDDVMYSGTVAGAREGSYYGLSAVAFSVRITSEPEYEHWADLVNRICLSCIESPPSEGTFLNVNFPDCLTDEIRITRLSKKKARSSIIRRSDPRGEENFWIGLDRSSWDESEGTDYWAVRQGLVSITPLHRDQTCYESMERLRTRYDRFKAG